MDVFNVSFESRAKQREEHTSIALTNRRDKLSAAYFKNPRKTEQQIVINDIIITNLI